MKNISLGQSIRKIFEFLKFDKRDIYAIYTFAIISGVVSLSLPLGIQSIIGFVMGGSFSTSIVVLVGLVLLGTFLNGLLQIKQLELIEKVEQKIFTRFSLEFGDRIPKLNLEKLDQYYIPELVNRFFDLPILQKSLQKLLLDIPPAILQIFLGTLLLSFYSPLFIAFGLLLLVIVYLILRFTSHAGFKTSMLASDHKYKLGAWYQDLARNMKVFKYERAANLHLKTTDLITQQYLETKTSHFGILKIQYWSLVLFKLLITAAMLIFGVYLLIKQDINIGQFIASDIVILAIIASVEKLIGSMDLVYEALTSIEKLSKLTAAETEASGELLLLSTENNLSLEVKGLSYINQNTGTPIIKDLNFKIDTGKWLNIYGDYGSGKTFLLHIIAGTYASYEGRVLVNSIPLKNLNLALFRKEIGILIDGQELFSGSLLDNISMGQKSPDMNKIYQYAEAIGLNEYIKDTELGYATVVDLGGKQVSSRIKHQILLLRVLIKNAKLFLLENPEQYLSEKEKDSFYQILKEKKSTVIITSTKKTAYCNEHYQI